MLPLKDLPRNRPTLLEGRPRLVPTTENRQPPQAATVAPEALHGLKGRRRLLPARARSCPRCRRRPLELAQAAARPVEVAHLEQVGGAGQVVEVVVWPADAGVEAHGEDEGVSGRVEVGPRCSDALAGLEEQAVVVVSGLEVRPELLDALGGEERLEDAQGFCAALVVDAGYGGTDLFGRRAAYSPFFCAALDVLHSAASAASAEDVKFDASRARQTRAPDPKSKFGREVAKEWERDQRTVPHCLGTELHSGVWKLRVGNAELVRWRSHSCGLNLHVCNWINT